LAHSVSHQLIIELNDNDLIVTTIKRDREIVNLQLFPSFKLTNLEEILSELPDIYSDVLLLARKTNFIILPEIYYQTDYKDLYTLNHILQNNEALYLDKSDHGFGILYSMDMDLLTLIRNKFLRIMQRSEVSVILSKIYKEINFRLPQIFITINKENLLIIAVNDGTLQLCNSYQAQNTDEIFYFVMLAIEQLQFLPTETELVFLGKPFLLNDLKELFKNYIQKIRTWEETFRGEENLINQNMIENSFALQSLLCE